MDRTADEADKSREQLLRELAEARQKIADLERAAYRDITAHKQIERTVRQANQKLEQRVGELYTLNTITQTVATATDLQSALEVVAEEMNNLFHAFATVVSLFNANRTERTIVAVHQAENQGELNLTGRVISLADDELFKKYIKNGSLLIISNIEESALPEAAREEMKAQNVRAIIVAPMRARGEIIGCIEIVISEVDRTFTAEEMKLAETIGGQIAGLIELFRLYEQERRQRQIADSLREIAMILSRSLSHEIVLNEVLEQMDRVLRNDGGAIFLLNGDSLILRAGLGPAARAHVGERIPLSSQNPAVRAFKANEPLMIDKGANEPHWLDWPEGDYLQSWIGAPLAMGQEIIGVLTIDSIEKGSYGEEDVQVMEAFAHQAALAIHNARLFEALQNQERFIQSIADTSPAILYVYSYTQDRTIYTNQATQSILGYTAEEIQVQGKIPTLIHLDDFHILTRTKASLEASKPGEIVSSEYRMQHKSGEWRWLSGKETVLERTPEGSVHEVVGVAQDITERKQAEEALRQSEEKYRVISEVISSIAYVYDVEAGGEFLRVWATEEAVMRVTGYSFAEIDVLGGWPSLIISDDEPQILRHNEKLRNGKTSSVEYRIITKSGRIRWIGDFAQPVWDNDQQRVIRIYGGCQDITDRKELEEQLRQAQKMEAIGQLAGGIAHHYNNILTAITGYASLAIGELPAKHPVVDDLRHVQEAAQRASLLTRQLLAFGRKQVIQPRAIDLNELLIKIRGMLVQLINETIELRTVLSPDLYLIKIDENQFEQLLINLVVNARDAMPNGGQLILETRNISLSPTQAKQYGDILPGHYVLLAVSDTGVGIPDDVKDRIFEPFFTTKEIGQGTGLGLYTCFGIVQQYKGHISVKAEIEQGTTFEVYFPRYTDEAVLTSTRPLISESGQGTETILVVEDEATVRDLVSRILRHYGYQVVEAEDGGEALAILGDQPDLSPDLLIVDVVMPKMRGDRLAAELKAKFPDLKVLYISGYADHVIDKAIAPELDTMFLPKPFTPAVLIRNVRAILDDTFDSGPSEVL